ncbi:M56 family metallopeptidase [Plebeiibacterium sediminum]|uniref:M56 family metallopeptidase n=1 Tax=Plebeiibacterium sediminum TaxID=2992112 RepID=A0AAE3M4H9_9BACT|nr:M56 family metallopeptidase [Plebeiobacterium sediminum]MCW3786505.1 M56 family metallopeptidase [Plebeiobacterium sediminum]
MAKFLIYLFESGLCLTLFYLGYVFFFRKETYFTFNRIYLVGAMVLSLIMPLGSVSVNSVQSNVISETIVKVSQFRNYYEELILLTDPDYAVSHNDHKANSFFAASKKNKDLQQQQAKSSIHLIKILFYIYLAGLLFFVLRLIIHVFQLAHLVHKNKTEKYGSYTLVLLTEEVPSFSFLRWIFINKEALTDSEFKQVLEHERIHVKQKHTVDLLLAQIIISFQWFNPLTWRIQKSIKSCHEYIADRHVLEQGHQLFDYQSLLLSQLISIRSVELVNNFNLLSIKKRIAMMNKIKSGRLAKLKAIIVLPLLAVAFLFFVNMTKGTLIPEKVNDSIIGDLAAVTNTNGKIDLPFAKEVKPYDEDFILCRVKIEGKQLYINDEKKEFNQIEKILSSIKSKADQKKVNKMTVLLIIDKAVKMELVDEVKSALRNTDLLKIGYVVNPAGDEFNGKEVALFALLPPKDAMLVDESKIDFLFTINDADVRNIDHVKRELGTYIKAHEKYVMLYKYNNSTLYNDYMKAIDAVWSTIFEQRREFAFFKSKKYDDMTFDEQKEIKKRYPITLTFKNIDLE